MKTVIVVFSDPQSGTQEALGRVVNALFLAYELKEKNRDFDLVFQGTGVRWPAELVKPEHPGHALYEAVLDHIVVCGGCADVFGAGAGLAPTGIALVRDKTIPGTTGVLDLSRHLDAGHTLVTF
ncbi:DsrE family protein [Comamonas sp.]|uniref:DsrE family protein n=1 Tax=Comamonas sp. TaxID=34028 RepID=UPI003D0EF40E